MSKLDEFFNALKILIMNGDRYEDRKIGLVKGLAERMAIPEATVREHLRALEKKNVIVLGSGATFNTAGRGRPPFISLTIVGNLPSVALQPPKRAPKQKRAAPEKQELAKPTSTETPNEPREVPPDPLRRKRVAIVVDTDNFVSVARDMGYSPSFSRIREFAAKIGRVISAEAFVSPRSEGMENPGKLSATLRAAGFEMILASLSSKDKDGVDEMLREKIRYHAEHSFAEMIIVVSNDRDVIEHPKIINLVKECGKTFNPLDPRRSKGILAGYDQEVDPDQCLGILDERMSKAVQYLLDNTTPIGARANLDVQLAEVVTRSLVKFTTQPPVPAAATPKPGFFMRLICGEVSGVQQTIPESLLRLFDRRDLKAMVNALTREGVFAKIESQGKEYLTIARSHPVFNLIAEKDRKKKAQT